MGTRRAFSRGMLEKALRLHKAGDQKSLKDLLKSETQKKWEDVLRDDIRWEREKAARKAEAIAYEKRMAQRAAKKRREREERLRHEEAHRKHLEQLRLKEIHNEAMKLIIQMIKDKKLTVTAKFMKSIKDPDLKRQIIEATCLSKV